MFQVLLFIFCATVALSSIENVTQHDYVNTIRKINARNISNFLFDSVKKDNKSYLVESATELQDTRKSELLKHSSKVNFSNPRTVSVNDTQRTHFLLKIHATITRSKDAVWATITLTFLCVLLVIAVAQSRMWKNYKGTESQGVPLPNFNEKVLFKDVMEHRIKSLKQIFKKKKKPVSEMESLLPASEWE